MAPVGASDSSNSRGMPRRGQPVVNRGANLASLDRWRTRARVAGDEENHALPGPDRGVEPTVDRAPGLVEVEPMQVEDPVRLDGTGAKALVPARIQRSGRAWRRGRRGGDGSRLCRASAHRLDPPGRPSIHGFERLARKRPDRRGHLLPQRLFFRAERSHGRRCLLERGSAPGLLPTFLPRSAGPHRQRPRRYRRDCFP